MAVFSDPAPPQPPLLNGTDTERNSFPEEGHPHLHPFRTPYSESGAPDVTHMSFTPQPCHLLKLHVGQNKDPQGPQMEADGAWMEVKPRPHLSSNPAQPVQPRSGSSAQFDGKKSTSFRVQSNSRLSPCYPSLYWKKGAKHPMSVCGIQRGCAVGLTLFGGSDRRHLLANQGSLERKPCLLHTILRPPTQGPLVAHATPAHPHPFSK